MNETYVVVDLETTGLNPKTDKIIEIGAIRIENGTVTSSFCQLVNPGVQLSDKVKELTNITDEDLQNVPYIEEVLPAFLEFAGDSVLIGHHVIFDFSFLKRAFVNQGMSFERKGIDTLRIARCFLAQEESKKLPDLCRRLGITHHPHRALSDVQATWELYQYLHHTFYKDALSDAQKAVFAPVTLVYEVKKEAKASKRQIAQLKAFYERLNLQPAEDLERLTKNEASRRYDRLVNQFGYPKKEV